MVGVKYEGSWFLPSASARYLKSGVFLSDYRFAYVHGQHMSRRFWEDRTWII